MMAALIAPMDIPATHSGDVAGGSKCFVGSGLVGAESAATLQD